MDFIFQEAHNSAELETIRVIENQVFAVERQINLPPLGVAPGLACFRLIARTRDGALAGCISVLESGANSPMFRRYGSLIAGGEGRSARYTRMAVLPGFRGQSLSVRLILEAQRRFIVPNNFRRTWLLLNPAQADKSLIPGLLGFECAAPLVRAEYGLCRVLHRDEFSITSFTGNRRGWAYLAALAASASTVEDAALPSFPIGATLARAASPPPAA